MQKKFAAAVGLAGLMAILGGAASAATIIPVQMGPFSLGNSTGTITSFKATAGDTYDFTFTTTATYNVLTQLQGSDGVHGSELLDFTVYTGLPGAGTDGKTSPLQTGPSLLLPSLAAGSYYIETNDIVFNTELVSGGIKVYPSPAPEPSTWGMMLLGLGAIGAVLRSAKRKYGVSLADAFKAAPSI